MTQHDPRPIGVFDSGIGGLTVLKVLRARFPHERFIYVADMANLPYGEKTVVQIQNFAKQIIDWFIEQDVKLVIMACNTSSAVALDAMKASYAVPMLGLIEPIAQALAPQKQRLGVIATAATVNSRAYEKAFKRVNPNIEVFSVACPRLVPLIEAHQEDTPYARQCVQEYLQPLLEAEIDTLVYGCTHYPYLAAVIKENLPSHIDIADPAIYVAQAAEIYMNDLNSADAVENLNSKPVMQFYATADEQRLQNCVAQLWEETYKAEWLSLQYPLAR